MFSFTVGYTVQQNYLQGAFIYLFFKKGMTGFAALSVTSCVQLNAASLFLVVASVCDNRTENSGLIVLSATQPQRNDSFHYQSLIHILWRV